MDDVEELKIKSNKKQLPLQKNKLIFKKFRLIKPIGKGTFSIVYQAKNILTDDYVAVKAEKRTKPNIELLESEAFILYSIRGFGIPEVLSFGRTKTHNILVIPLLGKSLLDIFIFSNRYDSINDISSTSIQILDRIEWIHSKNIIYRDIKPENFLFGQKDKDVLYLIDFGLCKKYKSSKTGKHIPPNNIGKFTGTSRYASIYAMKGYEQSRRDDIISIGYMIIFLMKRGLPWQAIKGSDYKECYKKLYKMKKDMKLEKLCKGLPIEIIDYMKYANSLKFEEKPNYKILKNFFINILKKNGISFDKYVFTWCGTQNLSTSLEFKKRSNSKIERKSSPHSRLFRKIQKSIENRKRSKSFFILNNNFEITEAKRNNSVKYYENSMKTNNLLNSETSNTLKAETNKNINIILNDSPRINMKKINFTNINDNNISSYKVNNISINKISLENINNHYPNLKQQYSNNVNSDKKNIKKFNNFALKKIGIPKNNKNNKIIRISPVPNDKMNKINKNINNTINNNLSQNKYNKINQIAIENVNKNNNITNKENNSINKNINENIIYNTYNTYNTYNSYNNTKDKIIKPNASDINIHQKDPKEIKNYQNNKRIKKNNYGNFFNNNIVSLPNNYFSNILIEKNAKSDSKIYTKNKFIGKVEYNKNANSISKNIPYINNKYYIGFLRKRNDSNFSNKFNNIISNKNLGSNDNYQILKNNSTSLLTKTQPPFVNNSLSPHSVPTSS